jgi:hypothetical protein
MSSANTYDQQVEVVKKYLSARNQGDTKTIKSCFSEDENIFIVDKDGKTFTGWPSIASSYTTKPTLSGIQCGACIDGTIEATFKVMFVYTMKAKFTFLPKDGTKLQSVVFIK